jgi:Domain of unknown function (DUF6285)
MADRPSAAELVEAVWEFLGQEVLPNAKDHREKFRTLVAMNALAIARRELEVGVIEADEEELRELARRIRAGDAPEPTLLKERVAAKLRISNPQYLERYK